MSRVPVCFAIVVLAGLAAGCASSGKAPARSGAAAPEAELRLPFEDAGACPFECCTYREWTVTAPTEFFRDRDRHSPRVFAAREGERVTGLTGVVVTRKPGRIVLKQEITLEDGQNKVRVPAGAVLQILHGEGEGYSKVWYQGRTYSSDLVSLDLAPGEEPDTLSTKGANPDSALDAVWWVQVKNQKGQIGWTDETDHFDGMDSCG